MPTLSPLERQRVAAAVQLQHSGVPVRWRAIGRKVWYVAHGKEHLVTSAGTDRVFWALVEQLKAEFQRETARLAGQKLQEEQDGRYSIQESCQV